MRDWGVWECPNFKFNNELVWGRKALKPWWKGNKYKLVQEGSSQSKYTNKAKRQQDKEYNQPEDDTTFDQHNYEVRLKRIPLFVLPSTIQMYMEGNKWNSKWIAKNSKSFEFRTSQKQWSRTESKVKWVKKPDTDAYFVGYNYDLTWV